MKPEIRQFIRHSSIQLLVYSALVLIYFFLVLHFLSHWLDSLFRDDRGVYAGVALGLIIGQGVALELLTTALLRLIRSGGQR